MTTPSERFLEKTRWALPCCPNCEHFSTSLVQQTVYGNTATGEYCILDPNKQTIPAKVIAFGCPRFSQDVPF